ncbi:rlx protein [Staphylococcus epidermidis FRI909]|nr:rlx protein [Staphylococcus epidermidis FRI909]
MKKGRLMMSMKDIKNNKEDLNMQTESRSTGTPSSDTQSNLNNEELNELKRQNKLIVNYLEEIQESQKTREKEQEAITSKLKETTEDFRDNSIKTHNDFVRLLQDNLNKVNTEEIQAELRQEIHKVQDENKEMLREVRASHEHYQKRQKQLFTGIGSMLLVFMLFALIMTIGSDFMSFLHVDILQKAIASKIKASEGFMIYRIWFTLYICYRTIYWLV